MVAGVNYRIAPVSVRERFWISDARRDEALVQLSQAEGIEEIIVLATCSRTEFLLWTNDVTLACNSVMRLLSSDYGLKLCEWKYFYRLLDEAALLHIFRVASSLDSMVVGEPQIASQVQHAWRQAQKLSTTGRFLDAVIQKALAVSQRVRTETALGSTGVSIPYAAVELARTNVGRLHDKNVLLIGAGKMNELSAQELLNRGARSVSVTSRTVEHASEVAAKLGGTAVPLEDRWQHMAKADIIISSTSCPHTVLSRAEAERLMTERRQRPLVIVDIAMPRDVDPDVRGVENITLYDLDDLEQAVDRNSGERQAAIATAQAILRDEAQGFRNRLMVEHVVPTIVALRMKLDEICRQELDSFRQENGPFPKDQDAMLVALMARLTQRIAGSMARELKELPDKAAQEQMAAAVQRLFHLQSPKAALAGAIS
jgi:glutamyl-tRNA reductase